MSITKATDLDTVYQAFIAEPLGISELADFYKDPLLARGEGGNPRVRMKRLFKREQKKVEHILFVGYRGCGKSTELNRLQQDIQDKFLVINYSIQKELNPLSINYIELFIVTMERLFEAAEEHKLDIKQELLDNVLRWTRTKEIEEISDDYISMDIEAGTEVKVGVPYLHNFFAKFKAAAKTSESLKTKLKTNIEPKLSELIDLCNSLIWEVRLQLDQRNGRDLIIIIEDLDKILLEQAKKLFNNYSIHLVRLNANVIFTFPIALYYSTYYNDIKTYFSNSYELPMIKVRNKDGSENPAAIEAMKDIVAARMDLDLFADPDILKSMILHSGGCMRDLFLMIKEAAEHALDYEREKIEEADRLRAYNLLKKEYKNSIADNRLGEVLYEAENYYKILAELAKSTNKQAENTEEVMHLRQNLSILGYNGEGWVDVHPLIKDILKDRGMLDA